MFFDVIHLIIILSVLVGVGFAAVPLLMALLITPRATGGDLSLPYECGVRPYGPAWTHFGISFYMYALLFISFDVFTLYLFPIAVYYNQTEGWGAFIKLAIFLFFLLLAVIYFAAKGVFVWQRKISL